MNIPKEIAEVLDRLNASGEEAYIVGGAVRDSVMGKQPHDYDIATSATPDRVKRIFSDKRIIETGIKHGTVTLLNGEFSPEITTYRCDGKYTDGRHPDRVTFSDSLEADLQRRDLTVNALAYNEQSGLVDMFGGVNDIKNGIIRCVGEPGKRFTEDRLRVLRAIRFASRLGFELDKATAEAVHSFASELDELSRERVFSELCKLLCGKSCEKCLAEYKDVIFAVIPALEVQDGFDQNNPNHIYTLYEHTIKCVGSTPPELPLRLAALLHDTGKPEMMTTDEDGISHFKGHPDASERIARDILQKLRASGDLTEHTCTLIKYHDVRFEPNEKMIKKYMGLLGTTRFFELLQLQRADMLSQNPAYAFRLEKLDRVCELARRIEHDGEALTVAELAADGNDIIKCGVGEGKKVGEILKTLLDEVMDGQLQNEKSELLDRVFELIEQK